MARDDEFLNSIKGKGYFSNTERQTKWYDGIDLTIDQTFRETHETVAKKSNIVPSYTILGRLITTDNALIGAVPVQKSDDENYPNRFFYQERLEEEHEYYKQFGCECCGRKLIMPKEIMYGLCEECDRRMFCKTKAKDLFSELPDSKTCCPEEFYQFNDKIEKITHHTQSLWTCLIKMFVRNKKSIENNKQRWHPYLQYVQNSQV